MPTQVINGQVVERIGNQEVVRVNGAVVEVRDVLTPQEYVAKQAASREAYNEAQAEKERDNQEVIDHLRREREEAEQLAAQKAADLDARRKPWLARLESLQSELVNAQTVLDQLDGEIDLSSRRSAAKSADRLARRIAGERLVDYASAALEAHKAQEPA